MIIQTLDGQTIEWNPTKHITQKVKDVNKSKIHLLARTLLQDLFPTCQLLEEVEIPLQEKKKLFIDLYIPLLKIAIEVQGIQHYERRPFFHKTPLAHYHQLKLDKDKREWCDLNSITLILLPYNKTDKWKQIIQDSLT